MTDLDHARGARQIAEALNARFGSTRTWHVTRGAFDTSIAVEEGARKRLVAYVRVAGDHLEAVTPGDSGGPRRWVLDASLPEIVEALVVAVGSLTLWDLAVGQRFRVVATFRGLDAGTELVLESIDEVKPSGRDLYRFRHASGVLDLFCDRPEDAAILDRIGDFLAAIA